MAIKRKLAASLVAAVPVLAGCDAESTMSPGLEVAIHSVLGGLEKGEAYVLAGADIGSVPLLGGENGAEYIVVPFYATGEEEELDLALRGDGVAASAPVLALAEGEQFDRPGRMLEAIDRLRPGRGLGRAVAASDRAHEQLRTRMRREAMQLMRRGVPDRASLRRSIAARRDNLALANLAVGDLVTLNVQADLACENPQYRTGKVVAISERAIVVADTLNPADGFDENHYRTFASEFDELVHPVVSRTFGDPTDIDGNGKVIIFFTSAVNDLTPPGSEGVVLGFFYARDLFPKTGADGCEGSNEAEMFYMLVPDPERAVEEPIFSLDWVAELTMGVVAHEYQHLINSARRIYVNNADTFEEIWLDEALSHVAEELIFYEAAGMGPRRDINLDDIFANERRLNAINRYMIDNLVRYGIFLEEIEGASIFTYDLAGRGGSWSFLRYVADRSGKTDMEFFYDVVNAKSAGLANLGQAAGENAAEMARDWAVSVYTDNFVSGLPDKYKQLSWNFRDVLPAISIFGGAFPLADRRFDGDESVNVALRGGGTAVVRVSVDAASKAVLQATKHGGGSLPNSLMLTVLRTR